MSETTRPVPTHLDKHGVLVAKSIFSPTSNTVRAAVTIPRPDVIPIVFVPGIMGSNLKAKADIQFRRRPIIKAGEKIWNVDTDMTIVKAWLGRNAAARQLLLNKDAVLVDRSGLIELQQSEHDALNASVTHNGALLDKPGIAVEMIQAKIDAEADKRRRGWGTVSWGSYGDFLGWLELTLAGPKTVGKGPDASLTEAFNQLVGQQVPGVLGTPAMLDRDGVRKLMRFQFPVHACGYNWLQSNMDSGKELADEIQRIIDRYNDPARTPRTFCTQVIVITHSMGGLVARAAALAHGAQANILAVIHGVMPTDGAAAFYKRFVGGFIGEGDGFIDKTTANIAAMALGNTGKETTPVLGFGPGPMELAPNHLYNGGRPWLFIKNAKGDILKSLPEQGNPYAEIYRTDAWWQAINPAWLNPAGVTEALTTHGYALDAAEDYHRQLGNRFHPQTYAYYGVDPKHKSWGTATWHAVVATHYDPQWYDAMPGDPPSEKRQWFEKKNATTAGDPAQWRATPGATDLTENIGISERTVHDGAGQPLRCTLQPPADPGDGTVPGLQSAAAVDSHCQVAWRLNGYVHQGSYQNDTVRCAVLDAVVRAVAKAKARA